MRWTRALVTLMFAAGASAECLPDFVVQLNFRSAEHIVVVRDGGPIDGRLTVLEAWRGTLAAGDRLRVDAAAELHGFRTMQSDQPTLKCDRMVLFLVGKRGDLRPASYESLACSTVWIEERKAYTWQQKINPGPCLLTLKDERGLRACLPKGSRSGNKPALSCRHGKLVAIVGVLGSQRYVASRATVGDLKRLNQRYPFLAEGGLAETIDRYFSRIETTKAK